MLSAMVHTRTKDVARALTSTLGRPAAAAWWSVGSAPARCAKVASVRSKRTAVRVGNSHSPSRALLHSQMSQTQVRPSSFLPCIDAGTAPPLTHEFTRTAASERCQQEPLGRSQRTRAVQRATECRATHCRPASCWPSRHATGNYWHQTSLRSRWALRCLPSTSVRQDSMPGE